MTEQTDSQGRPVRIATVAGITMFLDTVVGLDDTGKAITVASLNAVTGEALHKHKEFFECVCDAATTINTVAVALQDADNLPFEMREALRDLFELVWPELQQEEKPAPIVSEDGMGAESLSDEAKRMAYESGFRNGEYVKAEITPTPNPYDGRYTELARIWERGYLDGQK